MIKIMIAKRPIPDLIIKVGASIKKEDPTRRAAPRPVAFDLFTIPVTEDPQPNSQSLEHSHVANTLTGLLAKHPALHGVRLNFHNDTIGLTGVPIAALSQLATLLEQVEVPRAKGTAKTARHRYPPSQKTSLNSKKAR